MSYTNLLRHNLFKWLKLCSCWDFCRVTKVFSIQLFIELPELEKPIPEKNKGIKEWKDGFERKENWVLTTSKTIKEWNGSKTQKILYIV